MHHLEKNVGHITLSKIIDKSLSYVFSPMNKQHKRLAKFESVDRYISSTIT